MSSDEQQLLLQIILDILVLAKYDATIKFYKLSYNIEKAYLIQM